MQPYLEACRTRNAGASAQIRCPMQLFTNCRSCFHTGTRTDWLYKVAVAPGRPCTIQLAEDSSAVAQALRQYPQKTMVYTQPSAASAKGPQQKQSKRAVEMPQLQGWLCDRCDRGITSRLWSASHGGLHHTSILDKCGALLTVAAPVLT